MSDLDFTFDSEAAEAADSFSTRIDTTGKYTGKITLARAIVAGTGTKGVSLVIEAADGGLGDVTLYTTKADGQKLSGYNQIQSMMGLLGLKTGLRGVAGRATFYDPDTGGRTEQDATLYPDLCGKPLGFVLQKRLYTKRDGTDGWGLQLVAVFDAQTGATWSERKAGAPIAKIAKLLSSLKDKDERKAAPAAEAVADIGSGF